MGPKKQFKIIFRSVLLVAITAVALLCLNNHKVYAIMVPNDKDIPGDVETAAENACDITGNGIANPNWLSPTYQEAGETPPAGSGEQSDDFHIDADATSVYVAANSPTTLFWNAADMYCNTGSWGIFTGTGNNPVYTTQTTENTVVDLYSIASTPDVTSGVSSISSMLGINYPNACTRSADPGEDSDCDNIGATLKVSPTYATWFSNVASVEFTIPPQIKGEKITLTFETIGISQFTTGQFLCVNNPGLGGERYNLYNFDGNHVPIGDAFEHACTSDKHNLVVYIGYTVNISGTIYTYSPLDGKKTLSGIKLVLNDTNNGKSYYTDSPTNGTGPDGTYNISGVPLGDGFTLSLYDEANSNNFYISPSGGDMYTITCTGTPEPTDPPWCTPYHNYIDQVAGSPQVIIRDQTQTYYNRGADNGYDFVYPLFAITGAKVDTNDNNLPDFGATVGVLGTTDNTTDNPFSFDDLPMITGNYTVEADASYTDSSGTIYNLVGSVWCETNGCNPSLTDHPVAYTPKSSGTYSVSFGIPGNDNEVEVNFIYKPAAPITVSISGTKVDTNNTLLASGFGANTDVNDGTGNPQDSNATSFSFTGLKKTSIVVTPDPTRSYGGNNYTLQGINWCSGSGSAACSPGFEGTNLPSGSHWHSGSSAVTVTFGLSDTQVVMKFVYKEGTTLNVAEITGSDVDTNDKSLLSDFGSNVDVNDNNGNVEDKQTNPFTFSNLAIPSSNQYVVTPDPARSYNGNNYTLVGSNWCNTAGCGAMLKLSGGHYASGSGAVTVKLDPSDAPIVMVFEYKEGTSTSSGMIMGTLVDTNNNPLLAGFNAHVWIPGIPADSSNSPTFTFTDELDLNQTYMLDADSTYTYNGHVYSLVGSDYCNIAGCSTSATAADHYLALSTINFTSQINLPSNGDPAVVHIIYQEDTPEIKAYKVDTANNVFRSDFAAEVHIGGILPPDNTITNPAIFTNGLSPSTNYNVSAQHSYVYNGNTYTLIGASWCNRNQAGCVPGFDAADDYQLMTSTTTIQVFVPTTNPVVVHFEYQESPPATSNNCPLVPGFIANKIIPLTYTGPNIAAPPADTSQPATNTTTPSPIEEDDPVEVYYKSPGGSLPAGSITDISTGLTDQTASHNPQWVSQVTTWTAPSVTIDYSPYITYYPYDTSQPQINYYSVWNKIIWTPQLEGYSCTDSVMSGFGSSAVCITSANAPYYYTCVGPNNSIVNNGTNPNCVGTYDVGDGFCYHNPPGTGDTCPYTGDTVYYCISGTLDGTMCDTSTVAAADYHWTAGSPTKVHSAALTTTGPTMPECYDRTFQIVPNAGSIQFNDSEDPSSIEYDGSVTSNFATVLAAGLQPVQLRIPSKVDNINLTLTVTVQLLDGNTVVSSYPMPAYTSTTTSGTGNFKITSGVMPSINGNFIGSSNNLTEVDPANAFTTTYTIPSSDQIQAVWSPGEFQYGDEVCATLNANPSGTLMDVTGAEAAPTTGPTASPQTCSNPLGAEPYIKVFGGDVSAGTATNITGQQCVSPDGISAYNSGSNNSYAGSGTQLAAFAVNTISGFASAQNDTGAGIGPLPTALTFANKAGDDGNFVGSTNDCSTDYYTKYAAQADQTFYGTADAGLALQTALATGAANGGGNFAYQVDGGTIGDPSTPINIPTGDNIAIYSNGPITIAGNITYGGVSTQLSQMPNLEIITDNAPININSAVTQLSGEYVAEGVGGIISDCADIPDPNNWYAAPDSQNCGQELTVDGSFTANALYLSRTNGSLHEASTSEAPGVNNAAEEFDYSPSSWLTYPNQKIVPDVQSITSLPPVL